jgi:hypothetical protein
MKKMLHAIAIAAIVILASLPSASADNVLLTCEQSDGWSYFLEGGMVTEPSQLGWKRGGIAGKLQLVVRDNPKALDLVTSGGVNNFAYIADGCTMSTMPLALNKNETVINGAVQKTHRSLLLQVERRRKWRSRFYRPRKHANIEPRQRASRPLQGRAVRQRKKESELRTPGHRTVSRIQR